MALVTPLSPDHDLETKELAEFFNETLGFCPNSVLTMQRRPAISKAFINLNKAVMANEGRVTSALKRMIAWVSSNSTGCKYCQAHAIRAAERYGAEQEKLDNIWEYKTHPAFSETERVALDFSLAASLVPNAIDSDLKKRLYEQVIRFYKLLKENYVLEANAKKALACSDSIVYYQEIINRKDKNEAIAKYQAQFETKKAEYDKELAELAKLREERKVWIVSGLFILACISIGFVILKYRQKRKAHESQMHIKDLKIDELLHVNELENLKGLLEGQEGERKRIAQDLHDTIEGCYQR